MIYSYYEDYIYFYRHIFGTNNAELFHGSGL
jgi:hypothetical protein